MWEEIRGLYLLLKISHFGLNSFTLYKLCTEKSRVCSTIEAHWAIPENIHTSPMDDIGNPVRNVQWVWLEIHIYLQNFVKFNRNSRKTIQIFPKFWNSSRFESEGIISSIEAHVQYNRGCVVKMRNIFSSYLLTMCLFVTGHPWFYWLFASIVLHILDFIDNMPRLCCTPWILLIICLNCTGHSRLYW